MKVVLFVMGAMGAMVADDAPVICDLGNEPATCATCLDSNIGAVCSSYGSSYQPAGYHFIGACSGATTCAIECLPGYTFVPGHLRDIGYNWETRKGVDEEPCAKQCSDNPKCTSFMWWPGFHKPSCELFDENAHISEDQRYGNKICVKADVTCETDAAADACPQCTGAAVTAASTCSGAHGGAPFTGACTAVNTCTAGNDNELLLVSQKKWNGMSPGAVPVDYVATARTNLRFHHGDRVKIQPVDA